MFSKTELGARVKYHGFSSRAPRARHGLKTRDTKSANVIVMVALCLLVQGCASYATPGAGADFKALGVTQDMRSAETDGAIRQALDKRPLASFPTGIAVARVQAV